MAKVLSDFALCESASNLNIKNIDFRKVDSVYMFNPLSVNGISKAQYDSAIAYYAHNPKLYKGLYEAALKILNDKSDSVAKNILRFKEDSLKKIH
ncbi:MAG: DUF4296 domain-containing protein [Bacteroidetes bacterium]|nr:DUF4296 domain-containing protein [Bacteroidota bacterium]